MRPRANAAGATGSVLLAALALVLLMAGCGATVAHAHRRHAARPGSSASSGASAPCKSVGVQQSADGAISGCMRVDSPRPGPHTVQIVDMIEHSVNSSALRQKVEQGRKLGMIHGPRPKVKPEPPVTLSISPESGPPGTLVTVTGRLSTPLARHSGHPQLCWGYCSGGLMVQSPSSRLHWTSDRSFSVRVRVPSAPWFEAGPVHVAGVHSGPVMLELDCLIGEAACGLARSNGSVRFLLRVAHPPRWCQSEKQCASLRVSPAAARPGQLVRISGYAPLAAFTGTGDLFSGNLQVVDGPPHGSEVVFSGSRLGQVTVHAGHAALEVLAPRTLASLGHAAPVTEVRAGFQRIAADPSDPGIVAWCAGDRIHIDNHGRTTSFTSANAAAAIASLGHHLQASGGAACAGVMPLGPRTVVAELDAAPAPYGAPPVAVVALETTDAGRTWRPVPIPHGSTATGFGGLRVVGGHAVAVFEAVIWGNGKPVPSGESVINGTSQIVAERPVNGGVRWQLTSACGGSGSCVTLGVAASPNCAMGAPAEQPVLRTSDGGRHWTSPQLLDPVNPCGEAQLYSTASGSEIVVSSMSSFPVQMSTDGGRSWQDILIPAPPGVGANWNPSIFTPDGLTVLPDGSLLLVNQVAAGHTSWHLLPAGGLVWCRLGAPSAALQQRPLGSQVTVIGDQLWWLTYSGHHQVLHRLRTSALVCGS